MYQVKKILYTMSSDLHNETILKKVFRFALKKNAHITFFTVLKSIPKEMRSVLSSKDGANVSKLFVKETKEKMTRLLQKYIDHPVKFDIKVNIGDRYQLTLDELHKHSYDLLMTTYFPATRSFSERLFGSKYMFLFRNSPCPILVFRPKRIKKKYRLLIAIDIEDLTKEKKIMNRKIIDYAFSISQDDEVDIHMIYCWILYGESSYRDGFIQVGEKKLQRMLEETEETYHQHFEDLLKGLTKKKRDQITPHLVKGEAIEIIPGFVKKNKIDMVVLGTVSRSGISSLTIGNTAEDILQNVDCSVLAVKPD